MWTGLHQLILPAVLLNYVDYGKKNTALGLLTFAGMLMAAIIQPISGTLSDRWKSKWGRRRPLLLLGTICDFLFLAILAWAGGLVWLAAGYIGLQITSNIAHGSAQGLLPDRVSPPQRGLASGIKNIMDMAGLLTAMLVLGRVLDSKAQNLGLSMMIVAIFLACGAAITLLGIREKPSSPSSLENDFKNKFKASTVSRSEINSYTWLIVSRFIYLFGVYGVQGFIQYYIRDVMRVDNPVLLTANVLAMIILALMTCALAGGFLGDRIGHKRVLYLACAISCVGSLLLLGAHSPTTLLVYGSIFGAGLGLFLTSNWALANILAPSAQAGKYLGISNLATAGAGAAARLIGPFVDILNNARDGLYFGYSLLFIIGSITAITSVFILRRVGEMKVME
jgi:MFS family permease